MTDFLKIINNANKEVKKWPKWKKKIAKQIIKELFNTKE